ncbi:MAG: DUF3040 domain-containing protein, partial [Streptosporangiales bacterium]
RPVGARGIRPLREDDVPLSEHEQRELEQIERYLAAEDPKFVSSIRSISPRTRYKRRIPLAILGFVVGMFLLLAGVARAIPLSIVGFVIMTLCALWAISIWRHLHGAEAATGEAEPNVSPPDAPTQQPGVTSLDDARKDKRKRKSDKPSKPSKPRKDAKRGGSSGGFMSRIEARWQRRRNRGWY